MRLVLVSLLLMIVVSACGSDPDPVSDAATAESAVPAPALPRFAVLDSALTSRPGKTQYTERLVLEAPADSATLRALLESRLAFGRQFSSQWHSSPTLIGSYVFSPDADPTGASWLAMVLLSPIDSEPQYTFNSGAIEYALNPPAERFGMAVADRHQLFTDLVATEQRARCEAEEQLPMESSTGEVTIERMKANVELQDRLKERYEAALLRERSVSQNVADSVSIEGLMAQWPMPEAPCD